MQAAAPAMLANCPAEHVEQTADAAAAAYRPAEQSVQPVEPGADEVPELQAVQLAAPAPWPKVPGAQRAQLRAPASAAKVPGAQRRQSWGDAEPVVIR